MKINPGIGNYDSKTIRHMPNREPMVQGKSLEQKQQPRFRLQGPISENYAAQKAKFIYEINTKEPTQKKSGGLDLFV